MDRGLAVFVSALVGGLIALQPAVNAGLGKATGSLPAALVSFLVGTLALTAIVAVAGKIGGVSAAFEVEPIYLVGGLLGAVYVTTALITVGSIGAGGVAAATVTGQLTASIVLDHLGVLGLEQTALSWDRILGAVLLLAGTLLIVR